MTEDDIPQSLHGVPEGHVGPCRGDLIWRTRVLPESLTGISVTLAIDVHGRVGWAPRGDRGAIGARALRLVVQVTETAVREGFWAELRPAHACHDPQDGHWTCAALLHLVRQSPRSGAGTPPLPPLPHGPDTARCPPCGA